MRVMRLGYLGRAVVPFILIFSSFSMAEVRVYSTVDANRIRVNETINFKVVAEGSDGYPLVDISQIKDFTVISGPAQSSSFQWINGKMSSSKSLSWTLIPNKTGNLTIPGFWVKVDGKEYELEAIRVTVYKSRQRGRVKSKPQEKEEPKTPPIFLEVQADKEEAYQGEQITVYYRLYTRVKLRQYSVEKKPQGVGFWQEELYAPKQPSLRETIIDGVRYQVATLYKIAIFPTSSGELELDPMVLNCTIEVPSRSRVTPFFDDFFSDSFFTRTTQRIVSSGPLKFQIKPVPQNGMPANYTGAVGTFKISSYLDTVSTETNQAVSFTIKLTGTGNLGLFQLNEPDFPEGLEVFAPKTSFEKEPFRDEITGTKKWEYVIIPRREGRYFLPKSELSYLNPKTGQWERTSTEVLTLNVRPGLQMIGQPQGLTKEEIALLGKDIRYVRTSPIRLKPLSQRLIPPSFIWLNLFALLLFGGPKIYDTVQSSMNRNSIETLAKRALKKALKQLRQIKDSEDYGGITTAVYEYFGDKKGIASLSLDTDTIQRILEGRVSQEELVNLVEILKRCDMGRFAPDVSKEDDKSAPILAKNVSTLLRKIDPML